MKTMRHNTKQLRSYLLAGLLAGASLTLWNCSGGKKETSNEASTTGSDSSFMGRQGDTANSSTMNAPQQAPPDSASARQGAVVPAEIEVKAKR